MEFKPTSLFQFYKRHASEGLTPIHQSNPQPFSVAELENLIGERVSTLDAELELSYAGLQGELQLRQAISNIYGHKDPEQLVTFVGAQEAIFCCMISLLKAKDKVVAITPIFGPLIATAKEIGCEVEMVTLKPENKWQLDLDELKTVIKNGCKLLIINFPHNPTGAMISKRELLEIIALCEAHDCWILSDEVFRGLEHKPQSRLPAVADLYEKAISISVLSKAFALPAIRLGWISCQNSQLIERMLEVKTSISICTSRLDEIMALKIIPHYETIWQENRKRITENLVHLESFMDKHTNRFEFIKPRAGCVCFPLLKDQTSVAFTEKLIKENKLMVLPNKLFFTEHNGFRLSYGYQANIKHYSALV